MTGVHMGGMDWVFALSEGGVCEGGRDRARWRHFVNEARGGGVDS